MKTPLALTIALLLLAAPAASALPQGATLLVDRPAGALPFDGVGDSFVAHNALSSNGCFVVFTSEADALSPSDDNTAINAFRRDRCSAGDPVVQVNTSSSGAPGGPWSDVDIPTISEDGRYVAFRSNARNLVPGVTAGVYEIYLKDLATGKLDLVSRGDGPTGQPVTRAVFSTISGDGRHVAFVAEGVLDTDNVNGVAGDQDAYVRSLVDDTTHMVSVTTTGTRGGGVEGSALPAISFNGDRAAFVTHNKLDGAADGDSTRDAYVRNGIGLATESTQLATYATGQTPASGEVNDVALSDDSGLLAFSDGGIWVAGCAAACEGAVRWDEPKTGGTNTLPGEDPFFARPAAGGVPQSPSRVYWRTRSALDPADTDGGQDIYGRVIDKIGPDQGLHLMTGGAVDGSVINGDATDDGSIAVFDVRQTTSLPGSDGARSQVFQAVNGIAGPVYANLSQSGVPRVNGAGDAFLGPQHATSDDGRIVAFQTRAPALGTPVTRNGPVMQIVVRDIVSGATTPVSVAADGRTAGNASSLPGGVDAGGRRVAFTSAASNLVAGVTAGVNHAYVRDLAARRTILLDRTAAGTPAMGGATTPLISADGTTAVFESRSPDLPGAPPAGSLHVYVVNLASGAITLADRSTAGVAGDSDAFDPDISGDGRRVAFISSSTNFGGGTQARDQVYIRDLVARTTTWASVPQDGDPAHSFAHSPSVSRDGRRVAFTEQHADFGFGAPDHDAIFVRDLAGGTTLASTGPLGPADQAARDASLSADGTKVAFVSDATNLPGGGDGFETAYVRDLVARTTVAVANGRASEQDAKLSGNGACVAFVSSSDDIVHPSYGPDFNHVFLRALSSACAPSAAGAARDTTAPVIRALRVTHRRFAVARRRTARAAKLKPGTTFVFRLSERARTTITIARRHGRHRVARLVRAHTHRGTNRIAYSGRIGRRALAPGSYVASVRATDAAGNSSKARSVRLSVVRR